MKIGGTINFGGEGLRGAMRMKCGGVRLTFADEGSCEFVLEFSPENSKRLAAVAGLMVQKEDSIQFKEGEGVISAEDLTLVLYDQDVIFGVDDPENIDDETLPTIQIRACSDPDRLSGLFLALNTAQAEELRRRLDLFLSSMEKHAEACKPKRIGRPAAAKGAGSRASA